MKISLETLHIYAAGKAPIVGIPHTPGSAPTAMRKDLLQTALSCPYIKAAHIDSETGDLTINGTKRACYKLFNLNRTVAAYLLRRQLKDWAAAQKKRLAGKALYGKQTARAAKLEAQLRSVQKKIDRNYGPHFRPDEMPMYFLSSRIHIETVRDDYRHDRKYWANWIAGKSVRVALAHISGPRLAGRASHRKPETWAQFYAKIAAAAGRSVSYQHTRECNRKGGPTLEVYLQSVWKQVGQSKPNPFDHWEGELRGDALNDTSEKRSGQRQEYLQRRREYNGLLSELANLKDILADYRTENAVAEVKSTNEVLRVAVQS